jgi:hypothetical protein
VAKLYYFFIIIVLLIESFLFILDGLMYSWFIKLFLFVQIVFFCQIKAINEILIICDNTTKFSLLFSYEVRSIIRPDLARASDSPASPLMLTLVNLLLALRVRLICDLLLRIRPLLRTLRYSHHLSLLHLLLLWLVSHLSHINHVLAILILYHSPIVMMSALTNALSATTLKMIA